MSYILLHYFSIHYVLVSLSQLSYLYLSGNISHCLLLSCFVAFYLLIKYQSLTAKAKISTLITNLLKVNAIEDKNSYLLLNL